LKIFRHFFGGQPKGGFASCFFSEKKAKGTRFSSENEEKPGPRAPHKYFLDAKVHERSARFRGKIFCARISRGRKNQSARDSPAMMIRVMAAFSHPERRKLTGVNSSGRALAGRGVQMKRTGVRSFPRGDLFNAGKKKAAAIIAAALEAERPFRWD